MPDREKVINGLREMSCRATWKDIDRIRDKFQPIINDALALLKEQEAVAPNPVHNSFRWFACGKCDCSITREDRFCPRCGRQVKWE